MTDANLKTWQEVWEDVWRCARCGYLRGLAHERLADGRYKCTTMPGYFAKELEQVRDASDLVALKKAAGRRRLPR